MRNILFTILLLIIVFISGIITGYKFINPKIITEKVEVIKNVDRIVYRDYSNTDCCQVLLKYDTTPMIIDYKVLSLKKENTDLELRWKLSERSGEQEIKVPVYQEGNWKFYAGLGIGAGIIGGLTYMVLK